MANLPSESDPLRQRLNVLHGDLLELHKALLDLERGRYEAQNGHVATAGEMLQLVIQDPHFDWLHALSELIVEIDEFTEGEDPLDGAAADLLVERAQALLTPDDVGGSFQKEYARALGESPDVARLHARWQRATESNG